MKKLAAVLAALNLILLGCLFLSTTKSVHAQLPSFVADPCAANSTAKSSVFANITTATTTQLVALVTGKQIFVCGFTIDMGSTATADTVIFVNGTGASCGTGTTSISPTYNSGVLADSYKSYGGSFETVLTVPASNALCVTTTVGTGPFVGILVTYVQQ